MNLNIKIRNKMSKRKNKGGNNLVKNTPTKEVIKTIKNIEAKKTTKKEAPKKEVQNKATPLTKTIKVEKQIEPQQTPKKEVLKNEVLNKTLAPAKTILPVKQVEPQQPPKKETAEKTPVPTKIFEQKTPHETSSKVLTPSKVGLNDFGGTKAPTKFVGNPVKAIYFYGSAIKEQFGLITAYSMRDVSSEDTKPEARQKTSVGLEKKNEAISLETVRNETIDTNDYIGVEPNVLLVETLDLIGSTLNDNSVLDKIEYI